MILVLSLQHRYDFAYVVAPLILSDKMRLVEAYVGTDNDLRMQLVTLFDQWASWRTNRLMEFLKSLGLDPSNKGLFVSFHFTPGMLLVLDFLMANFSIF